MDFPSCPCALDLPGGGHEWVVAVRVDRVGGESWLVWVGGHEHRNRVTGPVRSSAGKVAVPTDAGLLLFRPVDEDDHWLVFPANVSAWEAYRRGL